MLAEDLQEGEAERCAWEKGGRHCEKFLGRRSRMLAVGLEEGEDVMCLGKRGPSV